LPDVPTLAETGYEIALGEIWYGAVAPAGTSRQIIAQRAGWFTAALESSEVKAKLVTSGIYPAPFCGDQYAAFLRQQSEQYGRAIRDIGIKG
jgi:tripartite-type tricarboxylate transporter receptor subunit TctC